MMQTVSLNCTAVKFKFQKSTAAILKIQKIAISDDDAECV